MPPYSDAVLSDKEIADMYAFLQTLPGRRPEGHTDPQRLRPFIGRERACEKSLFHTRSSSRKKKSSSAHSRVKRESSFFAKSLGSHP